MGLAATARAFGRPRAYVGRSNDYTTNSLFWRLVIIEHESARTPAEHEWLQAVDRDLRTSVIEGTFDAVAAKVAATVAAAAVVEAELAASAAAATEHAVLAAARTVADAAALAARDVAAAFEAKAAVVAAAAAAAAESRRIEARLLHDVLHDELTGLATRGLLIDRLTQALARATRAGTYVAVLFIDLDRFKSVNDALGHAAGDQMLVGVGRLLQHSLRDTDTCARVGGDEFVVVCEDLHDPADSSHLVTQITSALASGVSINDETMPVHASIGMVVSSPGSRPLALLAEADAAMYDVKGTRTEVNLVPAAEGSSFAPDAEQPAA